MNQRAHTTGERGSSRAVVRLRGVELRYRHKAALQGIDFELAAGSMAAVIGPDGVGKSSLLALIAGVRAPFAGQVEVLGGDMKAARHRRAVGPRIAYMPQGLGRNLYATLTVHENIDFFGSLFGLRRRERQRRIAILADATGLSPFADRPAGKLSGGMKQKLGLCCALIHDPDLLILDEPTTGVDPLSRRQFWDLIARIRASRPLMTVLVATAYMEEAWHFDALTAMIDGQVLSTAAPQTLLRRTATESLEAAFIALLPEARRQGYRPVHIAPRTAAEDGEIAIEAEDLTMRFGEFTAVEHVSFRIRRGEIFGFIGSNGCGKTTTMKMLTGLLPPTAGRAWLFGEPVDPHNLDSRRRIGYMTQGFSLYDELTVAQNLELHARLFQVPAAAVAARVAEMLERFDLTGVAGVLPRALPLGRRQRLSLAVAMIHKPEVLILDEPTSGVDPVARDAFWQMLADLSRRDRVTIFISTHFMSEAERCDRVSLMHGGRVLASDAPRRLRAARDASTLEDAFISYLQEAAAVDEPRGHVQAAFAAAEPTRPQEPGVRLARFGWQRLLSLAHRETLELLRDPVRLTLALLGSVILLTVMGYGISLDVKDLTFAVLDRDHSAASRDYTLNLSGSPYFVERAPLTSYRDLERRLRAGTISLALEIPPGFGRDLARGRPVAIGAWIDGSMPNRAETVRGYVEAMQAAWLASRARASGRAEKGLVNVETRFRYNPNVESLPAMVPAVIPLLLMMIPAMLTALSVVREKELGSIVNFYVTPITRLEFLVGKQLPYIALSMASGALLVLMAIVAFDVPITGSVAALALGALLYVSASTAYGLLLSTFMRSQIAAIFGTAVLTILPAVQFSGLMNPVSSLQGAGRLIGSLYPTTYFLAIARGAFSKGLLLPALQSDLLALLVAIPVLLGLAALLLKKQER